LLFEKKDGQLGEPSLPKIDRGGYSKIQCPKTVDAANASMDLAAFMKTSTFRVVALPTEVANAARDAAAERRPDHRVMIVDSSRTAPCRHCLQWAQPGERVILFPYHSIPSGRPYSETGPIFVHAEPCQRYEDDNYPAEFRSGRVFRAYNSGEDLLDAYLPNGEEPEAVIEKLFGNPDTAFVHARSVTHGCYTFRIERI
jgi:uncharacterized protein DUF1203